MTKYILILLIVTTNAFAADRKGIFYYEKPPTKESTKKKEFSSHLTPTQTVEKLKEAYNNSLNAALILPTNENIVKERRLNKLLSDISERYQVAATRVINNEPSLNYTLKHPVNHASRKKHDSRLLNESKYKIKRFSKENGLIFFFSSTCPHCHNFAPTVKMLEKEYGFTILPVSIDGKGISDFPQYKTNHGQAEAMMIKSLPALAIAKPKDNTSFVISYGDVSLSEIEEKLIDIMENKNV